MENFFDNNVNLNEQFNLEELNVNYNENKDFTTLEAWKKARLVTLFFYKEVITKLPDEEKYNLNIQIRKASVGIIANISESYGRYHYREGIQFYRISRDLLYELKNLLTTCYDMCYVNQQTLEKGLKLIEDTKITLNGFINYVKSLLKINKKEKNPYSLYFPFIPYVLCFLYSPFSPMCLFTLFPNLIFNQNGHTSPGK